MASLKIQGHIFTVQDPPYVAGHVLADLEAKALCQTWLENIRNNMAGRMRAKEEELCKDKPEGFEWPGFTDAEVQGFAQEILEYSQSYTFAQRTQRAPIDPVENEAHKMATALIRAKIKEAGVDIKSLPEGKLGELVGQLMDSDNEHSRNIRKEAKRRVEAAKRVSADVLGSLSLGNLTSAAAE